MAGAPGTALHGRCRKHRLPAGPDGLCLICRRDREVRETGGHVPAGRPVKVLLLILAVGLLAPVAYLAYQKLSQDRATQSHSRARAGGADGDALSAQQAVVSPRPNLALDIVAEHPPLPGEEPQDIPAARPARPAAPAPPTRRNAPPLDTRRVSTMLEVRAASRRVQIEVYVAPWCGACRAARRWLDANSISYTAHDLEQDPSHRAALRRLNPRGSIPTFSIGGKVLVGFSRQQVSRTILAQANSD